MTQGEHFKVILTVRIVPEAERDKFQGLSRPETYRRIRPHYRVGQRGCYEVEMTSAEYEQALSDAGDANPDSNLIAAERAVVMETHLVPSQPNRDYAELRRLSEDGYDATGVAIAVIDRGITTAFRDAHFAGRVSDAEDFTGEANPYALYGGDEHGCYMASLAIPPEADLIVAKVNLTSDVAESFYWITDETTAEIVSISLATSTPSTALADAVDYARDAGLLIFASAGNDGNTTTNYPSSYDGAHKISNFDHRTDAISPDSTFGADVFGAAGGNDHTVWNASGSEFYIEAGGTSCATAMAARIAAYVVGKFGSGSAISTLTSTARDAGAPSNKQGAGVLRLVHGEDRDPPVPVIPVGQSRDFDIDPPTLPPIEGPGTQENPSGSGGSSACREELEDLVNAVNTDPSPENTNALISFIEAQTGASIEDLMPEWSEVVEDGLQRSASVEVCGATLTITIAGAGPGACEDLPTFSLGFPQNVFSMPVVETESYPQTIVDGSTITTHDPYPDVTVSLQDPEFTYVSYDAGGAIPEFVEQLQAKGYFTFELPYTFVGDVANHAFLRVKGSWTCRIAHATARTYDYDSLEDEYVIVSSTHRYFTKFPLMGFHNFFRFDTGPPGETFRLLSEPDPEIGTYADEEEITNQDSELPNGIPALNLLAPAAASQFGGGALGQPYGPDNSYWLPSAVGSSPTPDTNPVLPQFDSQFRSTEEGAWSFFLADVEAYNDFADGPYDPVLTVDEEAMEITVTFDTNDKAMYLPVVGCESSPTWGQVPRGAWAVSWGGYWQEIGWAGSLGPRVSTKWRESFARPDTSVGSGYQLVDQNWLNSLAVRIMDDRPEDNVGYFVTGYRRLAAGENSPGIEAAETAEADGRPPDTEPNPPIAPVGGGCKSSVDGPSSCTWHIPDNGDIPLPGDNFGDFPVVHVNFPKFPPIGCHFPDFGNMDPCAPGSGPPGFNGPGPGGRDKRGKRGNTHGTIKTGGKTYGNPRKVLFDERTCYGVDMPGISCFTVITMLLMDCGISALDIVFQVTSEWDKPFPENKCFRKGSRKWDAANWTARYLGLDIIDEGAPTNNVYIGPRYHRPGQSTWHFWEHIDFFGYDPVNSSEEMYSAVVVFGPGGISATSLVESPFATEDFPIKYVEVGPNHSQADAELLASYHASLVRREAVSVQVTVPYSSEFFLRDKAVTHAPDRGFETHWIIMGKESDISVAERLHILTLMLPETVRELDELPTSVASVDDEIPGTEFAPA